MATNKNILQAKENHVDAINAAIDALINLEDFHPLSNDLSKALSTLNSMRNVAEEDIIEGQRVWDTVNKEYGVIQSVGELNYFFEGDKMSVGIKFCFPVI